MVWAIIDGYLVAETEQSLGFGKEEGSDKQLTWLPKSQIEEICYVDGGDSPEHLIGEAVDSVSVPQWLAEDRGLEYEEE